MVIQEGRFVALQERQQVGDHLASVSEKHYFLQYSSDLRVEDIRIDQKAVARARRAEQY